MATLLFNFLSKLQRLWRIAPENDDFFYWISGHLLCNLQRGGLGQPRNRRKRCEFRLKWPLFKQKTVLEIRPFQSKLAVPLARAHAILTTARFPGAVSERFCRAFLRDCCCAFCRSRTAAIATAAAQGAKTWLRSSIDFTINGRFSTENRHFQGDSPFFLHFQLECCKKRCELQSYIHIYIKMIYTFINDLHQFQHMVHRDDVGCWCQPTAYFHINLPVLATFSPKTAAFWVICGWKGPKTAAFWVICGWKGRPFNVKMAAAAAVAPAVKKNEQWDRL